MSLADALRVIQARDELVDLELALALLGLELLPASPTAQQDLGDADLDDDEDEDEEEEEEDYGLDWSQDEPDDLPDDGWLDSQVVTGPSDWPMWWTDSPDRRSGGSHGERAARPIPYVLGSEDILKAKTEFEPNAVIDRPRSEHEQEQLVADRIAQYTGEWGPDRIRRVLLRSVPGKLVDVGKVVLLLAEGKPLKRIPTLPRFKVSPAIQVVYDVGLFAGPYGLDLHALIEAIRLAGATDMERLAFRHRIAHGCGTGPAWDWEQYRAPAHETTIVLVSGGYGDDVYGRVSEFQQLMSSLHRHGHPVHAIWFGDIPQSSQLTPHRWIIRP
jgi:hypothetical protein